MDDSSSGAGRGRSRGRLVWSALLLGLFAFRVGYGLCAEFWPPDERQVYLLGLKFYGTGMWPYFGPDVVYTQSQVPGALQGLLVGVPLYLLRWPEAPMLFLNLLSFGALAFFAWYLTKRLPDLPRWFIWIWVMTCPWALAYSTHVVNPSYVLPFAVVFFVAIFETLPLYQKREVPRRLCWSLLGLAVTAIMQLHMSWVLLLPFVALAFYFQYRAKPRSLFLLGGYFLAGCLVGIATLIPTLIAHGVEAAGGTGQSVVVNFDRVKEFPTVLARFLSFASFEITRMLGSGTGARLAVVKAHLWMAPATAILLVAGIAQVFFFAVCLFIRGGAAPWSRVRGLTWGSILLVYFSFFFSIKGPSSHTFYLMFPVAMLYSLHCYRRLVSRRWARPVAVVLLVSGFIFHAGLAVEKFRTVSLYRNRSLVVKAIENRDYLLLGPRRADEWGHGY